MGERDYGVEEQASMLTSKDYTRELGGVDDYHQNEIKRRNRERQMRREEAELRRFDQKDANEGLRYIGFPEDRVPNGHTTIDIVPPTEEKQTSYTIEAGDTLTKIAKAYSTTEKVITLNELLALNPKYKDNPNLIKIGDTLVLPKTKVTEPPRTTPYKLESSVQQSGEIGNGTSDIGSIDGTVGLNTTGQHFIQAGNGYPGNNPNYLATKTSTSPMQPSNLKTETWQSGSGAVLMSDYGPVRTQFGDQRLNTTTTVSAKPDSNSRTPAEIQQTTELLTKSKKEIEGIPGFIIKGDTIQIPGGENMSFRPDKSCVGISVIPSTDTSPQTINFTNTNGHDDKIRIDGKTGDIWMENGKGSEVIKIGELPIINTPIEGDDRKQRDITSKNIKDVEKFGINEEKLKMINSYGLKIIFTPAGSNNSGDTIDIASQGRSNTIPGERSNGTILRLDKGFSIHSNKSNQQKFENISIKTLHGVPMLQFDLGFNDNYFGKSFSIAPYGNMEGADKAAKMDNFGLSHGMIDFLEKNNIEINPNTMQDLYPKKGYTFGTPFGTGSRDQDHIPDGDSIKKVIFSTTGNTIDGYVTIQLQSGYNINFEPRLTSKTKKVSEKSNPIDMGESGVPMEAKKFGLTPDHIRLLSRYGLIATFQSKYKSKDDTSANDRIDIKNNKERQITYSTNNITNNSMSSISLISDARNMPTSSISRIEEREVGGKTVLFIEDNTFKYYYIDNPGTSVAPALVKS